MLSTGSLIRTSTVSLLAFQCAILAELIEDLEHLPAFKQLCFGLLPPTAPLASSASMFPYPEEL